MNFKAPSFATAFKVLAVALLGAVCVVAVVLALRSSQGSGTRCRQPPEVEAGVPRLPDQGGLPRHIEIADVRSGIVLYTDPKGTPSSANSIALRTRVAVACVAPNDSGIASINAFYLIATAPWRGLFASANQFANQGPVGVTSNGHTLDRRLGSCRLPHPGM